MWWSQKSCLLLEAVKNKPCLTRRALQAEKTGKTFTGRQRRRKTVKRVVILRGTFCTRVNTLTLVVFLSTVWYLNICNAYICASPILTQASLSVHCQYPTTSWEWSATNVARCLFLSFIVLSCATDASCRKFPIGRNHPKKWVKTFCVAPLESDRTIELLLVMYQVNSEVIEIIWYLNNVDDCFYCSPSRLFPRNMACNDNHTCIECDTGNHPCYLQPAR